MAHPRALAPVESSEFSQHGEDGVLATIFERIGENSRRFVEIGAADGDENCTRALLDRAWTGVWVEGDPALAAIARTVGTGRVQVIDRFVDRPAIVELASEWRRDDRPDLAVIDIDGNDYWIWSALLGVVIPRVVVIEYNGSFGPDLHWVARYRPDRRWDQSADHGAALAALDALGRRHSYRLVHCDASGTNAFFVHGADAVGFPDLGRRLFQPPVHKLPGGHPSRYQPPATTEPATGSAKLRVVWSTTDWLARVGAVYAVVEITNHSDVTLGAGTPHPTLVAWRWSSDEAHEPNRSSMEPWSVGPGQTMLLPVRATVAVDDPGDLALGLVQEGVSWLQPCDGRGAATIRVSPFDAPQRSRTDGG
jgi:hypothetical protein